MATKYDTRYHPLWSFYSLALSQPGVFPGPSSSQNAGHHKMFDECQWVSRFPTYPITTSLVYTLPRSHSLSLSLVQSDFFRRFSHRAGCNLATPIVVGKGGSTKRNKERKRRRTGCYICNIFDFTIFQLVCILRPLYSFFTSFAIDLFVLSRLFHRYQWINVAFLHPFVPSYRPFSRYDSFICVSLHVAFPKPLDRVVHKGFHFLK